MHIFPENAPGGANAVLLLEFAMGLALVAGAILARRRHYRAHAACQSLVVVLNLGLIVWFMVPSFHTSVLPKIPGHLGKSYYWLATAHGIVGLAAELLALYILLAAGTSLLPKRLRLTRYKPWMRTALFLWWLVILLGLSTYLRWYGPLR